MYVHIDIDSFFASAERAINPQLDGLPIAVGSRSNLEIFNKQRTNIKVMNDNSGAFVAPVFYSPKLKNFESYFVDTLKGQKKIRGIITTASYEARARGVKTAMPIAQALSLCPDLIVLPSNYHFYHQLSKRLTHFIKARIPKVEQFSIDEYFGDVSGWIHEDDLYSFAIALRDEILKEFNLPVSIGIAPAKWIAKVATEKAKPFGVYQVQDTMTFIEKIPIEKFPGIGKGFQRRLKSHNIHTLGEVVNNKALFYRWKKPGISLYNRIVGIENSLNKQDAPRKSIGISRTFDPIHDTNEMRRRVVIMARHIIYLVYKQQVNPTTYYLSIRYQYGIKKKCSRTLHRIFSESLFKNELIAMYNEIAFKNAGAIKLTLNVSNFTQQQHETLSLFEFETDLEKAKLSQNIQRLRERFGIDIVKSGVEL
ncbi:MAG TPA: DNA polymerase IV [Campylobacterales bacterium]|nr:DNA polymerase IV [Campylobacterales bacterium]HHS92578.1 DNA polymerase IV [Campylobacterales bacterium]